MENKLISAEALLHALRDDADINGTNFARVKQHIENAPAVVTDNNVGSKWIPVTERLPEKSDYYLAITDGKIICVIPYSVKHKVFNAFDNASGAYQIAVTHWMPLPEAPKGD